MFKAISNRKAILALLLLVPVPSLGVAAGLYLPGILVFYRIQNTTIEILRVFHGARDLANILSELDEEL
ncbi:type II toxin-antitoxin system RelE/ParE family toxin [Anabaena sp. CCY 9910]|uniref:type II toxin-antitoxin system RelE/ParE family toxin n=1 Tax=Anabaena sp. CCY 9910 TaxID=3103870 RepID=UPI0039E053D0